MLAGQTLEPPEHGGGAPVAELSFEKLAVLAAKRETHPRSGAFDVLVEERCQPIGPVVAGVLVIADPHQRSVEDTDSGGERQRSAEFPFAQVARNPLA